MIQDVKLGIHRIGTYMYAISKCAFLLGFRLEISSKDPAFLEENHQKWVWKGGYKKCSNGVAHDDS